MPPPGAYLLITKHVVRCTSVFTGLDEQDALESQLSLTADLQPPEMS